MLGGGGGEWGSTDLSGACLITERYDTVELS